MKAAQPQAVRRVEISIDAEKRSALRRIWRYVGYDEPNYTYTPRGKELLRKLGALADGPYRIRCHFLFCTGDGGGRPKWGSTNVYNEDSDGNPIYDFVVIDRIFDTIVESGCIPFVELGFTPKALTSAPDGVEYEAIAGDAGWAYPPKEYSRWAELVGAVAAHCLERYGLREVDTWYWELWNEPDIFYWRGSVAEYCRLFDFTESALHSVLPQARLGGPSVTDGESGSRFLEQFLAHCASGTHAATGEAGTRLDFITVHTKGGSFSAQKDAPKTTPTIRRLVENVDRALDTVARFPSFQGLEIILSECDPDGWAAGSKYDNPNLAYRNTEYYASYLATAVCKMIDLRVGGPNRVDGMLTWAFQFENREYFEGLRTLSTNGVDKPVLNVFRLLAMLAGRRIAMSLGGGQGCEKPLENGSSSSAGQPDLSGIGAVDANGTVRVFLASHHDDFGLAASTDVRVRIGGLVPRGRCWVTRWIIDHEHGNAHTVWQRMDAPQQPSSDQIERLRVAALARQLRDEDIEADPEGTAEVRFALESHSVVLVEVSPV